MGYSRGAYAVRSLAGVIEKIGLLQANHTTVRNIRQVYRHYQSGADGLFADRFRALYCHDKVQIEVIAVWDTVRALGANLPLFARWTAAPQLFHDHRLGHGVKRGYQALALDENRQVFAPVLWHSTDHWSGDLQQMWFPGCHADIGGQVGNAPACRPLSNIALVWVLSRVEACGLPLPDLWQTRFYRNSDAPSVGTWQGWGKLFWRRKRRAVGHDPSERIYGEDHRSPPVEDSILVGK